MNRKICYIAAVGIALSMTSCGKKLGQFSAEYFTTNPNPLEVVGEKVPATVTARVPAKFFVKNAVVTVTPYLVFDGQEVASQAYTFQGEKVRGNAPVISYEQGGTVTIPVGFTYQPEMSRSTLELAFTVTQGSKEYVLPRVAVANGVVATAALAAPQSVTPAIAQNAFQRIINEKYAADIMFLINQANIRAAQLNTDAMVELRNEIASTADDPRRVLEEINVSSYASPDGTLAFNERLAQQREINTTGYVNETLTNDKITEFGNLTAQFTAEDWAGFKRLVEQSNIQDKDLILSVLSMYNDPEQREREIRNLAAVFEQLADEILPQLRYSRITASINVIGKSDAELMAAYEADPSQLSVEELLYTATLTNDNNKRQAIYDAAARLYPNDARTWNNLGAAQYAAGNYSAAANSLKKAANMARTSETQLNLGLLDMLNRDYTQANQRFGAATGLDEVNEALGVYYLKLGDNNSAVRAFGNSKSNNAALAQILTRDYNRAKSTLAGIQNPDATTYYLTAVLGARTNNESMLLNNLRQAISMNPAMAAQALNDIEFDNFNISSLVR